MEASQTQNGQIPLVLIHGAWLSARSSPGWQEVAAAVESWLDGVLDARIAATDQAT